MFTTCHAHSTWKVLFPALRPQAPVLTSGPTQTIALPKVLLQLFSEASTSCTLLTQRLQAGP